MYGRELPGVENILFGSTVSIYRGIPGMSTHVRNGAPTPSTRVSSSTVPTHRSTLDLGSQERQTWGGSYSTTQDDSEGFTPV